MLECFLRFDFLWGIGHVVQTKAKLFTAGDLPTYLTAQVYTGCLVIDGPLVKNEVIWCKIAVFGPKDIWKSYLDCFSIDFFGLYWGMK